ncbi:unnamed protein product [Ranitomeya imitator]|uniref:Beta/gamma crystallin 'Greek key' domain-containing protein n=1 Tax=Ranitomeya imitator TaxID=111125 RepID=A0ABN9KUA3_9NEOB|nr:unnamed protein product [Ranitomeya imitator]
MNVAKYRDSLDENLFKSALHLRHGQRFTFQQDSDPKHTAKITKEWLQNNSVTILDWPSQSPDLKPIGHLWRDLKMAVHQHAPSNLMEQERICKEEWQRIPTSRKTSRPLLNPSTEFAITTSSGKQFQILTALTIIFYEDKNFQGRSYECNCDAADLHSFFSRCNSIRVENGNWMIYEHSNYKGHQYFLKKGEYPDYQQWLGFNDSVRSCRLTPQHRGTFRIRVYEKEDFGGHMMEFIEDCPHVQEQFRYNDIYSCSIPEGQWIFYEEPSYRGRQYYLRPGEYRRYSEWGASSPRVGSFKRVLDLY